MGSIRLSKHSVEQVNPQHTLGWHKEQEFDVLGFMPEQVHAQRKAKASSQQAGQEQRSF